jgi:spore germination protein KB
MLENGKISSQQLMIFVIIQTIGDSILVLPAIPAHEAKQDAWIVAICSVGIGSLVVFLYSSLNKLYPNLSLIQYSEKILGKWLGITFSLLFLSYTFVISALYLREIGDFMTTQIMHETPIQSILILMFAVILIATSLGLEPIIRSSELLFPFVILLLLPLIIFLLPDIKLENIQPVFEGGFKPIIRGSFEFIAFPFLELVGILMILSNVNEKDRIGKSLFIGALSGGLVLIIITVLTILVLGADITERQLYPSYTLARKINIANFLTRIEAFLASIWIITIFFKIAFYFYITALGFTQTFKLRNYRFLIFPLGVNLIVFSLLVSPNISDYNKMISDTWWLVDVTFGFFLPFLLLIVGKFRVRKGF